MLGNDQVRGDQGEDPDEGDEADDDRRQPVDLAHDYTTDQRRTGGAPRRAARGTVCAVRPRSHLGQVPTPFRFIPDEPIRAMVDEGERAGDGTSITRTG